MNLYELIVKAVGYNNFYEGRVYPYSYVELLKSEVVDKKYKHTFEVRNKDATKVIVEIFNNGTYLNGVRCNCQTFKKTRSCPHIAAVLYQYSDEIFSSEYVDEKEASLAVLNSFLSSSTPKIKEKVNLELEFDFFSNYVSAKVLIGTKKLYVLKDRKFNDFIESYHQNSNYEFGKQFNYNPDIHYFDEQDKEILNFLASSTSKNYYYTNQLALSFREFEALLILLKNRPFTITNYGLINGVLDGLPTKYQLIYDNNDYQLIIEDFVNYRFLANSYKYVFYNNNLYRLNEFEINYLERLKKQKISNLTFKKEDINTFSEGLFRNLKSNLEIAENITDITIPSITSVKLYFDILYSHLQCKIVFNYKGTDVNYFDQAQIIRDKETEDNVFQELSSYGFIPSKNLMILTEDDLIFDFLENTLPSLVDKYEIFTSKKIDNTKFLKKLNTNNNFSIGQDGIMSYQFDAEGINPEELSNVFKALQQKKRYYKLKNNNIVSLEDNEQLQALNDLIEDLNLSNSDINSGSAEIPKYRALYIDSLKENKYKNIKTNNLFDEFIANFTKYRDLSIKLDKEDEKILRDYQKEGVKWLTTIYKCDFGGILADEMGLGKSIQTICFIKEILKEKPNAKILIVSPTSLIYNWQKEFDKFGSKLKYVVVSENKQHRKEILKNQDKYNIFITTYGLVRNDNDEYENIDFELCVIDEAQAIKNYQAGMTKEIKKIKAKCKIALTGTPVENNITELWSIFDFIMPGYLNSLIKFKEKYNIKDVKEEDLEIIKKLSYQIKPFILRRKKSEVATSLPEKIENNIYIDLPDKQKKLYIKELHDTKKEMDEIIAAEGFQKARMKILQLLMKLRQICIDPSVMYENYDGERIKIEELLNIVRQNIQAGHKMLIFSSFKRVLENVKEEFKKENISFYMIDGSVNSKLRMQMVDAFNTDNTSCFLITLKAGGNGLNLTGADTVIHLDIWWNPQVENQATDRAHRIGQEKKVSVIKLITKGTIEERIIELQEKKKILSDNLIEGKNSTEALSSLTEKDIKKLLAFSENE